MFPFGKKGKRGSGDQRTLNTTPSIENIINNMKIPPPDQGGQVKTSTSLDAPVADHELLHQLGDAEMTPEVPIIDLSCQDHACLQINIDEALKGFGCFQVINYDDKLDSIEDYKRCLNDIDDLHKEYLKRSHTLASGCVVILEKLFKILYLDVQVEQYIAVNYYPPWMSKPSLTRGGQGQTDPNALSLHLLGEEPASAGMQIYRQGRWVDIKPRPGALLITIGDKMEALSEGKWKSTRYRTAVNPNKERISLGSIRCRGNDGTEMIPITGKSPAISVG